MLSASNTLVMIYINVEKMCFIGSLQMNVHNELFNGVRQLRWQHILPVVSPFSTSIRLLSSFFKKALHPPSLFLFVSVHLSLFSFCGTPSHFPN